MTLGLDIKEVDLTPRYLYFIDRLYSKYNSYNSSSSSKGSNYLPLTFNNKETNKEDINA